MSVESLAISVVLIMLYLLFVCMFPVPSGNKCAECSSLKDS